MSFLLERRFRTKTNLEHSDLEDLLIDVPWGSVLGHLLLNNYMCEFFLFIIELNIANHADDATLYDCETNLIGVENESLKVFEANDTKSHAILKVH